MDRTNCPTCKAIDIPCVRGVLTTLICPNCGTYKASDTALGIMKQPSYDSRQTLKVIAIQRRENPNAIPIFTVENEDS